jgi:cbb3-type cytochrome oxidase subunit 1
MTSSMSKTRSVEMQRFFSLTKCFSGFGALVSFWDTILTVNAGPHTLMLSALLALLQEMGEMMSIPGRWPP